MNDQLLNFCAFLGKNRKLVQGAGGNVSAKDGDSIWVKASGTRLGDADRKPIFSRLSIERSSQVIRDDRSVEWEFKSLNDLPPSIEAAVHILLPQKFVVHLHHVDLLALLVQKSADKLFSVILCQNPNARLLEYHKPGTDLARATQTELLDNPFLDTLLLKNHGIFLGGDDIETIHSKIKSLEKFALGEIKIKSSFSERLRRDNINGYKLIKVKEVQQLALNPELYYMLGNFWALYPDHVVFLGPQANNYENWEEFKRQKSSESDEKLVFIKNNGVFSNDRLSTNEIEQLVCYYDVLNRIHRDRKLVNLNADQIRELLCWDREKFRISKSL